MISLEPSRSQALSNETWYTPKASAVLTSIDEYNELHNPHQVSLINSITIRKM
jgi:hypothetical protein